MKSNKDMSNSKFTEIDLHCIARLLQSSFQAPKQKKIETVRSFYGCMYCKYAFECIRAVEQKGEPFHYYKVLKKLEELTGVYERSTPCALNPDDIGRRFFPASYYVEHPELILELEKIHPRSMMNGFKASLEKLIIYSREKPDQK